MSLRHVHCYQAWPGVFVACLPDLELLPGDTVEYGGTRFAALPTFDGDVLVVQRDELGAQVAVPMRPDRGENARAGSASSPGPGREAAHRPAAVGLGHRPRREGRREPDVDDRLPGRARDPRGPAVVGPRHRRREGRRRVGQGAP